MNGIAHRVACWSVVMGLAAMVEAALPPEVRADFLTPPAGFKVVYLFTGARAGGGIATSVHCTNVDPSKSVSIRVEFYAKTGGWVGFCTRADVTPAETKTFSTSNTIYTDDCSMGSLSMNQGSVRVLTDETIKVICTAQVLDAINFPPSFIVPLPDFDKSGRH